MEPSEFDMNTVSGGNCFLKKKKKNHVAGVKWFEDIDLSVEFKEQKLSTTAF